MRLHPSIAYGSKAWPAGKCLWILLGLVVVPAALGLASAPASAKFKQQGEKLVGSGAVATSGDVEQGWSVALSADGNTAIVGGLADNADHGAAWVFVRRNGKWKQQGSKLVGSNAVGNSNQGISVALSADGNTAAIGGFNDDAFHGAAWIFTRSQGVWTQQGEKLVGAGAIGNAQQGFSVALSSDGDTLIVGGINDNAGGGAAWVFTRNNHGKWKQQGDKLVGKGFVGSDVAQGCSVALSANGNTAIVGGLRDNAGHGAAWVFIRDNGAWKQQGRKLIGSHAVATSGMVEQGWRVALSANGNTAILGARSDNAGKGAAWVFVRNNVTWSQQGQKLVGKGAVATSGLVSQGSSIALSGDGDTALVGGRNDDAGAGAVWVFQRSNGVWNQDGRKLVGTGAIGSAQQGGSAALSADGKTAAIGGPADNTLAGSTWIFVQP